MELYERAEMMDIAFVAALFAKPVNELSDADAEILQFFLAHHPDPLGAIDAHNAHVAEGVN